ncbi:sugar phosphate isomerase/epimerase family protein [Ruegeria lacuscaerulensis]|uniref:sugar phosphate isomerase/epimerase family protein n=1 Tax=Ruegeria lacuscaerulensis TaxID=55218 RepID=UPI00147D5569|nr:sugar phosphate isomerase/epimerase [Ruegeria lacuscaerulensis]
MAQQVESFGLNVRSAHFDWEEYEDRFDDIVYLLSLLKCPVAVMPWLTPEARPDTTEGWTDVSGRLAGWAAQLADHDICFTYHNHDFDLEGHPGETPLDLILAQDALHWQPDIGWLAVSVPNPTDLLQRYSGRIVSIHAKDADPSAGHGDERWRNPGQGVVDWPRVLSVLENSPCADLFIEHDETQNHSETLLTGRGFLTEQLLARAW